MFRVYCTFINDKGQRDTYLYTHSGNGMIAHINGIMTEYVGLDQIREKVKVAKKIETLTLQSVTVRCGNRSATFFIDPALADIEPFYYLNCFGVSEHISLSRITTEKSRLTALSHHSARPRNFTIFRLQRLMKSRAHS
uniref:hypothetical protein n=1 Tax=Candidatus Limisoma sp. TaxID=3076476 RepID=UPI003FEFCA4E